MTKKSVAQNILVSALLICFFISPLYSKEKKPDYFDGPYVTWVNADTIVCVTVERVGGKKKINKKVLKAKDFASYAKTLPASELGYSLIDSKPEKSEFRADRMIAIGDLHGDLRNFKNFL